MSSNSSIGARMKAFYEYRAAEMLPRRTYTILRLDGKSFHTYTRNLEKPFDDRFAADMDDAAHELCREAMGVAFAYGQSDEYSFLLTDFRTTGTEAWFDGKVQKIVSVAASIFTSAFMRARLGGRYPDGRPAYFDARAFTIPDPVEVANYFIWRQQDATRNSINMYASQFYSPRELHGKTTNQRQEMLFEKGVNWDRVPIPHKRGRVLRPISRPKVVEWRHKVTQELHREEVQETAWFLDHEIPVFTRDRDYLRRMIPVRGEDE